jgi:hypothetical protein
MSKAMVDATAQSVGVEKATDGAVRDDVYEDDLAYISKGMRRRERKSYVFLALLVGVAVGAVGAGLVADSEAFWAAAGSVVVMASAGIVAYAASGLGVFAEMIDLIRRQQSEP